MPQHILAIDIETYSDIELKKAGMYKYAESPLFEILLLAYSLDGGPVQVIDFASEEMPVENIFPDDVWEMLYDKSVLKTAWNAPFEMACVEAYLGFTLDPTQWECTMALAAQAGLPLTLEAAAKALGLPEQKMAEGKKLIRYFCQPCKGTKANGGRERNLPEHAPDMWETFKEYNAQDVVTEMAVRRAIGFFEFPDRERRIWQLDQAINRRGILLDPEFITQAVEADRLTAEKLTAEAIELTGLKNPNSVTQLREWLSEEIGEAVESLGKDKVQSLLASVEEGPAARILKLRQQLGKTSVKKYKAMLAAVCDDNRVRGLHQYYGANRTGRWSGRIVQTQNLPKNDMDHQSLDLARRAVRVGDFEAMELMFDSVPAAISELVRTAFVAPEGHRLIVADFSAIEARVIAWLAGERWRLDVFSGHGKIYEASAAQMFKVPLEQVTKGSPLRQKGKIAELALGYQGGVGALAKMGALKMGLVEEELQPLVDVWRNANRAIVQLWYKMGDAALQAVDNPGERFNVGKGVSFQVRSGVLWMELPSGRRLAYQQPRLKDGKYGKVVTYMGMDQQTKKWMVVESYGGKFVENCIAEGTPVITSNGIKPIEQVTCEDLVWDGLEWVGHAGVVDKGVQDVIYVNGTGMTPDHKILTDNGWKNASSSEGHHGAALHVPHGFTVQMLGRKEVDLGDTVRLRESVRHAGFGDYENETEVMWLQTGRNSGFEAENAWAFAASVVLGVEKHEGEVHKPKGASVEELRRARHSGVSKVAGVVRKLLRRYGSTVRGRVEPGQDRRQRKLHTGKLQVCLNEGTSQKQTGKRDNSYTVGRNDRRRSLGTLGHQRDHNPVSAGAKVACGKIAHTAGLHPKSKAQVHDILNAGPRRRFTVLTLTGPLIVHNCVQAISRDILADAMIRLDAKGYQIVMHVHDEVVAEMLDGQGSAKHMAAIMSEPIGWAPGLPLAADAYETKYYKKD